MNQDKAGGAMSLWEQTRSQRWALVAGLLTGIVIGATIAILFRPLIIAVVIILLALLVYRIVRAVRGGGESRGEPMVRGMVITGRYAEPASTPAPASVPVTFDDDAVAPDTRGPVVAPREVRRGPEYDAEIDAILANIDRQITGESAAPRRRAGTPEEKSRSEPSRVQDADWTER